MSHKSDKLRKLRETAPMTSDNTVAYLTRKVASLEKRCLGLEKVAQQNNEMVKTLYEILSEVRTNQDLFKEFVNR